MIASTPPCFPGFILRESDKYWFTRLPFFQPTTNPLMVFYTLDILEHTHQPVPGTISSLVFKIPAPENISALFITRYEELRRERKLEEEGHYDEASGRLALQAYYDASVNVARDRWIERAKSVFTELVEEHKQTIRHVELVLPTGGFATPVDLFGALEDIEHLESFSVQWVCIHFSPE